MNATRREFLDEVFVLDDEELRKLHESLLDFVPSLKITIKCADKLERKIRDIEQLLEFENSLSKEIQSLSLAGNTENHDRWVRIDFENKKGSSIYLSLEGPEDALVPLSSSLQDRFESIRPWYAFLAKRDYFNVIFALLGILILSLLLFVGFSLLTGRWHIENTNTNDPKATVLANLIMLGILLGAGFTVFLLNRTQRVLFPIGVFAIGQGKKRYAKKEWVRTSVVVAFVISMAAGIVIFILTLAIRK